MAVSGQTVVSAGPGFGRAYVFTEPAGGWSGTVRESAQLTASDASTSDYGGLATWAIDGRTIVAGSYSSASSRSPGEAYVFTEPARGWSGKLHESARLFASHGQDGDGFGSQVAISRGTIAVSAPSVDFEPNRPGAGRVYVFTQPPGGWSGTVHESATLSASSSSVYLAPDSRLVGASQISVSGHSVFAIAAAPGGVGQVYVFSATDAGWSGAIHETAVLRSSDSSLSSIDQLAASGGTVVAGAYVFTEPAGGWVDATETAKLAGGEWVGIAGQTVVASGPVVSVFVEPAGGWSSSVQPTATLSVMGPSLQGGFTSAALSGGVLVAGLPDATVGANKEQGAVYVFTEPPGGWSSETQAAKLVASDGQANQLFGGLAAISGDTVVAGNGRGGAVLYVFIKPSGGWSGTLSESARLTVTDPGASPVSSVAISGTTIVAGPYVFTEPAGGWSGAIHQSATLTVPGGSYPCFDGQGSVAIDGSTIAAACSGHAYVFTEPASGWTGAILPSATLLAPSTTSVQSVAVIGSTVVAGGSGAELSHPVNPVIFEEPASGWSGTIQPAASLNVSASGANDQFAEFVAGSRDDITALVIPENDMCPILSCNVSLYAFTRPRGGWSGTINGPNAPLTVPGDDTPGGGTFPLAIEGRSIASGGLDGIDIFTITPGLPSIRNVSFSGLAVGRPRLRFALHAGQNAAPIRSFKLTMPPGLGFASHPGGPIRGVRVSLSARVARLRPGTLAITLRQPTESVSIAIAPLAIIERRNLITQIRGIRRYNRTHRRKRALAITIRCMVTDATSHTTGLALTTRIS